MRSQRTEYARVAGGAEEPDEEYNARFQRTYGELEHQLLREPGVRAVTFGDRLPGKDVDVRPAEVEAGADGSPLIIDDLWTAAVGPGYFAAFGSSLRAGRAFHDGDRAPDARTVIVNEAFVRRFLQASMH